jgi:lysyl-tRNA synthetase class 2
MEMENSQPISADEGLARLQKLKNLEAAGIPTYPAQSSKPTDIKTALLQFDAWMEAKKQIQLVGRIKTLRTHGGLSFFTIEDQTDAIQIALQRKELKEYDLWINNLDRGDFVEVKGDLFLTHKGEKTLSVKKFRLLAKSLLPLPEKWHGLSDTEIRYRQRYLDLVANADVRNTFVVRSVITGAIREFLNKKGFVEVDTPILQPIYGGANAKPFTTHHNALDMNLFLRIAPELYLKRLLVGGFEKVYEIARCFRNEGIDHSHNPEFTQVEFYWAYSEYKALMKLTEKLLAHIAGKVDPSLQFEFNGKKFSLKPPYKIKTYRDIVLEYTGLDIVKFSERAALAKEAERLGVDVASSDGWAHILDEIFKKKVRVNIIDPTFVIDYPLELSPLAKKKTADTVERFQLVVGGMELCNAFSELNDPLDQEARFKEQEAAGRAGDEEAQPMDNDYVVALKHGMPPAAGFGMGIDRLTMLLTNNHSIKEVILFPTLKAEK